MNASRCCTHHGQLVLQGEHSLFPAGHQLLQVLVPELLAGAALPRALPAAFQLGLLVDLGGLAARPLAHSLLRLLVRHLAGACLGNTATNMA